MNKQKLLHFLTLVIALCAGVFALDAKIKVLGFIDPRISQYWPLILVAGTVLDRVAKIFGDWLDDGELNGSYGNAKTAMAIISALIISMGTCFVVALLFTSCSTNTGDPDKDRKGRVTNAVAAEAATVAWDFILSSGENYLKGQTGQDAASAAFAAAKDTVVMYDAGAGIARIRAAAGPKVAAAAQQAITTANPQTPAQTKVAFNSIGAAFQSAANATTDDGQP